jgi:hypothetical protein
MRRFLLPLAFESARAKQRGAALVESAVALGLVLFTGLAALEAMHWQMARQLAYVALTEAARAGAVAHARPEPMAQAFEAALLPRPAGRAAWRIGILQPGPQAYADFAETGLDLPAGAGPAIRNDYQAEQHAARRARWLQGKGPRSGLDIFQANRLRLGLLYRVPPWSPPLGAALRALSGLAADACARRVMAAGLLPLRIELEIDMQSHPARWPARGNVAPGAPACP